MDLAGILARAFTGGADELTGANLVRMVVDGIVAMKTRGRRGVTHLPSEVQVVVTVGRGSLDAIRSLINDPGFEEEISQRLQNRLVEVPVSDHPMRLWKVQSGERNRVDVEEVSEPVELELTVRGGQHDGLIFPLSKHKRDFRVGRGPLHGGEREENDLVITHEDAFVSRRAARIERLGGHVRVRSLDQGDHLQIIRRDGSRVRPRRTIEGWVSVRPGDRIELTDGESQVIALELRCMQLDRPCGATIVGATEE